MYSWVAVEGEPIPLKEAYTHDDARTMNQVVEHFTSDLREQFWGRSGPTHAAELARLLRPAVSRCPRISISVSGSMNGVQRGPMPGTACMSATLSRVLAPCESAWLGCGSGTSYRRALRGWSAGRQRYCGCSAKRFLRGLSTRAVARVVALLTEEAVSAQTVSRLTRDLDQAVAPFHQAPLTDGWQYVFLDGVSLRVRRPGGTASACSCSLPVGSEAILAGARLYPKHGEKSGGVGRGGCRISIGGASRAGSSS